MTERFIDIKVRTGGAEKEVKNLDSEMKKLSTTSESVNKSTARLTKSAEGVKTSLAGVSRSAGQAGIQIQQLVGQVQGGQNIFNALSAQAADLGFVLGAPLLGAVAGLSASLAGVLVPALFSSNKEIEKFTFNASEAANSLEELEDLTRAQVAQAIQETNKSLNDLSKQAGESGDRIFALSEKLNSGVKRTVTFTKTNQALIDSVRLTDEETKKLEESLIQEQATLDKINKEYKTQLDLLVELSQSKEGFSSETKKQEKATRELSDALSEETLLLQTQLGIQQQVEQGFLTQRQANLVSSFEASKLTRKQRFEEELLELGENNLAKEELQSQFDANELVRKELFEQQITAAEERASQQRVAIVDREAKLKQLARNQEISNFQSFAATGVRLIAAFGKKSFQAQKNFAIAESIVNIAGGVAKALNNPYPANLGFAAQVAAEGAVLLSTIKSTNPASSTPPTIGGASSSTPVATPVQEAPQQQRVVDIRLDDDAVFTGANVKQLFSNVLNSDDDIVLQITEGQQELVRTGAI